MDIQLLFQWHKLLHLFMPVILIMTLSMCFNLKTSSIIIFTAGMVKEIHDIIIYHDPIWLTCSDILFNIIGITIGIKLLKLITQIAQHITQKYGNSD